MSCNLKNSSDCYNSTNVTIITDSNGYKTIISVIDLFPREKFNTSASISSAREDNMKQHVNDVLIEYQ